MKRFYKSSDLFSYTYYFVDERTIIVINEQIDDVGFRRISIDNPLYSKYVQQAEAGQPISRHEFFKILFNYWHIMALELGLTRRFGNSEQAIKNVLQENVK